MLTLKGQVLKVETRGDKEKGENTYIKVLNDDEVVEVKVKNNSYVTGEVVEINVRFSCYNNRLYCKEVNE